MKVKTITILNIAAEAISVVTTAISMIIGKANDNDEVDARSAELKGSDYMLMSESMTTVRELLKLFPEQIITEELEKKRSDFYVHLFATDELYDLRVLHTACHDMHSEVYKILTTAREAVELYCD